MVAASGELIMAYVSNMQDDEEPKSPAQGAVPPSGGAGSSSVQLAPSSGIGSAGGSSGPAPSGGPAGGGGQFATLDKYISANQGQAQPLADKVTTGIGKQYDTLAGQNTAALGDINSQVTAGMAPSNTNDIIAKEAANPVSFSGDQGNVKQFQSLLDASYGGPTSAEGTQSFANQQGAINNAIATGKQQTTTEGGREQLLSQNEAAPSTSVTGLNSAILANSPEALGQVENAYKPFSNLLTNLSTGAQGINQNISKAQSDAAATAKASNDAIAQQINALNTGISGNLTATQQNATAQNTKLKADLAAGTPSSDDLRMMGMTSDQWNALSTADKAAATAQTVTSNKGQFGATTGTTTIDPTQFLTQTSPNSVINAANVATPEDYAKAQAFQTLLQGLNLQTPTAIINPATSGQAGTAPTSLNNYDYQTALNTATSAKADEVAAAQAYVDALQSGADENHAQLAAQEAAKKSTAMGGLTALTGVGNAGIAGAGQGIYNSASNAINNPSLKSSADLLNSIAGPKAITNAAQGIAQGVTGAVNTVAKIFCFHPYTLIEMADGNAKMICNIMVGDDTKGGKVLGTTRGIGQEFYKYGTVLVTGKHAVKEDGVWTRVENSRRGEKIYGITEVVCNITTEQHRIWVNGIEFADEKETDMYESLDLDESLQALNKL